MFTSQAAEDGLDARCSILVKWCPDQLPYPHDFLSKRILYRRAKLIFTITIHFMGQICTFRPTKRECGVLTELASFIRTTARAMLPVSKQIRLIQTRTYNTAEHREMVKRYARLFSELGTFTCRLIMRGS